MDRHGRQHIRVAPRWSWPVHGVTTVDVVLGLVAEPLVVEIREAESNAALLSAWASRPTPSSMVAPRRSTAVGVHHQALAAVDGEGARRRRRRAHRSVATVGSQDRSPGRCETASGAPPRLLDLTGVGVRSGLMITVAKARGIAH